MDEGYSLCLNEWALDKDIKNELGLLLIVSSLSACEGYCYASNKYLGELFDEPEQTISRKLKKLEAKRYITIEYEKRGCEITSRKIRLTKLLIDDKQKCESTINKNVKDNITSNNITSNKKENKKKKFVPPTLEEVETYVKDNGLNVNAKDFVDYFEATNWVDAKGQKVISWKGKIRTWNSFKSRQRRDSNIESDKQEDKWNMLEQAMKEGRIINDTG